MTISYPISLPTHVGFAEIVIREVNVTATTAAPFSGVQQVQEHPGAWWEAELSIPPMRRANAEIWLAAFTSLRGMVGTFLLGDPMGARPRGSARLTPGTPQVNGAGQSGLTLDIKTGLGAVTSYLKAGDKISLGTGASRRLHKVVTDVDLVGGNATVDIWPRLRSSPGNNDVVYVSNATGRFRLGVNTVQHTIDRAGHYRIASVPCREAL